MEFEAKMVTPNGEKMMYLISIEVKKDCENYDEIWAELERRMNAVSIPIIRVDWLITLDNGEQEDCSDWLFYAETFETGMGFIMSILKNHEIRTKLECCTFFNGDPYKNNFRKYDREDSLKAVKNFIAKYNPDEIW